MAEKAGVPAPKTTTTAQPDVVREGQREGEDLLADDRPERAAQRAMAAAIEQSPRMSAQRKLVDGVQRSPVVQRKVGFELEDGRWNAWKQGYFSRIYPAERKAVLHQGTGYKLEADDTPGPRSSNLEFVTEPFEETAEGLAALKDTLREIKGVVTNQLDPIIGAQGPENPDTDPPFDYDANRFRGQAQHHLTGPAFDGGRWLHLSKGIAGGRFKVQATGGASLSDLPKIMKYFGSAVPNETPEEKVERDPARASIAGSADAAAASGPQRVIGGSPAVAESALARFRGDGALTLAEQGEFTDAKSADLLGFLSAVILTMKMLQLPKDGVLKYRVPLMFRTDFAQMFGILPNAQKAILTAHPDVLARHVVAASNAAPLVPRFQGIDPDSNLSVASALIRRPRPPQADPDRVYPHDDFADLSIEVWMRGFTSGTDYLTPDGANAWLKSQGWWWWQRKDNVALLESFGSVKKPDKSPYDRKLGIFESRAIAPKGAGVDLNIDEASKLAWNQLLFYKRIEDMHNWESDVGKYPNENVGKGVED